MPTVYRIHCTTCRGGDAQLGDGIDGCVLTDGQSGGHPQELGTLLNARHIGLTASVAGRLAYVEEKLCMDCGTFRRHADLTFFSPGTGCLLVLLAPLFAASYSLEVRHPTFWAAVGCGLFTIGMHGFGLLMVRLLYRGRRGRLSHGPCPKCGSNKAVSVENAQGKRLPCPHCGNHSLLVEMAGVS